MKKLILSLITILTISVGTSASTIESNPVIAKEKKTIVETEKNLIQAISAEQTETKTEESIQTEFYSEESLKAAVENLNNICTKMKMEVGHSPFIKDFVALNETIRKLQQAEYQFK